MESLKSSKLSSSDQDQFSLLPFAVLEFSEDLRCIHYNHEGKDNFIGLEADFLIGRLVTELPLEVSTKDRFLDLFATTAKRKSTVVFNTLNVEGSEVRVHIKPLLSEGKISGYLTFSEIVTKVIEQPVLTNDIGEMKRMNQELSEKSRLFESVLKNISDGVIVSDCDGNFTIVNPAAENMFGFRPQSSEAIISDDAIHLETYDRTKVLGKNELPIQKALRGEVIDQQELILATSAYPGGIALSFTTRLLKDSRDRLEGAVLVMRDMSKTRKAQEKLEEVNRNLDSFVQATAHDLKSPVINMKNLFSLIERTEDEQKKEKISLKIRESVDKLDDLLGALMEIVDAQKNENIGIDRLSFQKTFDFIVDSLQEQIEEAQPQFELNLEVSHIVYNRAYLRSIFHNLLTNSMKYRNRDKPLKIRISTFKKNGFVELAFSDNGIGMNLKKDGEELFKPFKRLTSQAQGKGIGLNLIKSFVEKNGGEVKVESQKGRGTTFRLFLRSYQKGHKQITLF
ncbi:sensor histidine kinase [Halocola ammonii]